MDLREEQKAIFSGLDRIFWIALAVLACLYLASGIFVVEANEEAVVFRFGRKLDAVYKPGIGYHLPWPISRVKKVNVKEVQSLEVGFWPESGFSEELLPYCITGDKNIIHNRYVIQYRTMDAANFLTRSSRVRETLYELAQATILEAVASRYAVSETQEINPILTTGKREMENAVRQGLREKLEQLGLAITIVGVERQAAEPPNLVKDAFQDVISAREEKRSLIHEAYNYRNQEIPRAKGEADKILKQARAYKFQRISSAKGESERFLKLYHEYKLAPEVTRHRLFMEMVEAVLPRVKVMVLATDKQGRPLKIKLLQSPVPTSPRLPE